MRLFFAISLSESLRKSISDAVQQLAASIPREQADIRWIRPEQLHVTLKFLEAVGEEQVPLLTQRVESSLLGMPSFEISLGQPAGFPDRGPLRGLWAGLTKGENHAHDLAQRVEKACESVGFRAETRSFHAHVTLGRVKSARNPKYLLERLLNCPELSHPPMTVDSVVMFRSILGADGSRYLPLKTFGGLNV